MKAFLVVAMIVLSSACGEGEILFYPDVFQQPDMMAGDVETGPKSRAPTTAMRDFKKQTGYPNGRKGYVVDHIVPLCAGGPDVIDNLQWQERDASYKKDVFERELCRAMKREGLTLTKKD